MGTQENKIWSCSSRTENQCVNICPGQTARGKKKKLLKRWIRTSCLYHFLFLFLEKLPQTVAHIVAVCRKLSQKGRVRWSALGRMWVELQTPTLLFPAVSFPPSYGVLNSFCFAAQKRWVVSCSWTSSRRGWGIDPDTKPWPCQLDPAEPPEVQYLQLNLSQWGKNPPAFGCFMVRFPPMHETAKTS